MRAGWDAKHTGRRRVPDTLARRSCLVSWLRGAAALRRLCRLRRRSRKWLMTSIARAMRATEANFGRRRVAPLGIFARGGCTVFLYSRTDCGGVTVWPSCHFPPTLKCCESRKKIDMYVSKMLLGGTQASSRRDETKCLEISYCVFVQFCVLGDYTEIK